MEWLNSSSFMLNSIVYKIVEIRNGNLIAVNWKGQQLKFPCNRLENITISGDDNGKKESKKNR